MAMEPFKIVVGAEKTASAAQLKLDLIDVLSHLGVFNDLTVGADRKATSLRLRADIESALHNIPLRSRSISIGGQTQLLESDLQTALNRYQGYRLRITPVVSAPRQGGGGGGGGGAGADPTRRVFDNLTKMLSMRSRISNDFFAQYDVSPEQIARIRQLRQEAGRAYLEFNRQSRSAGSRRDAAFGVFEVTDTNQEAASAFELAVRRLVSAMDDAKRSARDLKGELELGTNVEKAATRMGKAAANIASANQAGVDAGVLEQRVKEAERAYRAMNALAPSDPITGQRAFVTDEQVSAAHEYLTAMKLVDSASADLTSRLQQNNRAAGSVAVTLRRVTSNLNAYRDATSDVRQNRMEKVGFSDAELTSQQAYIEQLLAIGVNRGWYDPQTGLVESNEHNFQWLNVLNDALIDYSARSKQAVRATRDMQAEQDRNATSAKKLADAQARLMSIWERIDKLNNSTDTTKIAVFGQSDSFRDLQKNNPAEHAEYDALIKLEETLRQRVNDFQTTFRSGLSRDSDGMEIVAADNLVDLDRMVALLKEAEDVRSRILGIIKAEATASSSAREAEARYEDLLKKLQSRHQNRDRVATVEKLQKAHADFVQTGKVEEFTNAIDRLEDEIRQNGTMAESTAEKFNRMFSNRLGYSIIAAGMAMIKRGIRDVYQNVVALDSAMTELKKVTDETDAVYNQFLKDAATRAKTLGASLTDVVSATADAARLGLTIPEAEALADASLVYKNVGDGISDINQASESIVSTMQAFGIDAQNSMVIVDKFNEVGNNFAITSTGIGDALLNSASAMKAANNSLDETIALITAANRVIQDPAKVGTALKTVSMYLRTAKTEAEEAGESTDGMAGSVSELRQELLELTGNKVDIQADDQNFKSTYQILKELAGVWDELTDVSQANILEMIGGKCLPRRTAMCA